jgi:hypothetical protein
VCAQIPRPMAWAEILRPAGAQDGAFVSLKSLAPSPEPGVVPRDRCLFGLKGRPISARGNAPGERPGRGKESGRTYSIPTRFSSA